MASLVMERMVPSLPKRCPNREILPLGTTQALEIYSPGIGPTQPTPWGPMHVHLLQTAEVGGACGALRGLLQPHLGAARVYQMEGVEGIWWRRGSY